MKQIARAIVLLVLCMFAIAAPAQTRAWLDRDRIALGETATLNIETGTNAAPDYAPLLPDFDLSAQSSQQQLAWTNGSVSSRSLYAVALRPRRDGLLHIPALRVGGRVTAPLTLLVTAAPAATATGGGDVFIQSEADSQDPYVQQSVAWVVRLYSAVPLIAGQLDQPEPAGASLQRIGDDVQYRRMLGSRPYVVTERRYLLIPERSGELVIPPARFDGRGTGNALDQLFGSGQTELHATARPRVLKVRPIPADAPQPWLPLRSLTLRYLALPGQAKVGSAVNVVVELEADGAAASQLPDLQLPATDAAQVFPERPQSDESMVEGRPRVRLQRRFAIVPTRAGALVIAGPRIGWWDSRAGVARTAALPPIRLQVAPGATPAAESAEPERDVASAQVTPHSRRWMLVAIALLAIALVAAGLVWRSRSRAAAVRATTQPEVVPQTRGSTPPPVPRSEGATPPPLRSSRGAAANAHVAGADAAAPVTGATSTTTTAQPKHTSQHEREPTLARLLELGDLADIETALRRLAGVQDLDAVIARLDDAPQREAVDALRRARWADGDAALARSRLRDAFAAGPRWREPPARRPDALPPLYPEA